MTARLERLREGMRNAGFDALICRLPENILYLTNYWSQLGLSMAVFLRDEGPILFLPEVEADYTDKSWAELRPFGWGLLKDRDLPTTFREGLTEVRDKFNLSKATIGIEEGFEVMAPPYNVAELCVPASPTISIFREVFSGGELRDSTTLLQEMRAVKTPFEIEQLKIANELASFGLGVFVQQALPGKTEAQVGAAVEEAIRSLGQGYKGVRLARAIAEVRAGVGSFNASLWVASRNYRIREGDIVMIELAVIADGYWSDLTRVVIAGEPTEKQKEVYTTVLEAQKAAVQKMRAGVSFSEVDKAARQVIDKAGYGEYFVHITGHGIGFRYHEFIPLLAPQIEGKLAAGMVSSVEPGVYIPDWGGIRIEDNIAVTEGEPEYLSHFDRAL